MYDKSDANSQGELSTFQCEVSTNIQTLNIVINFSARDSATEFGFGSVFTASLVPIRGSDEYMDANFAEKFF